MKSALTGILCFEKFYSREGIMYIHADSAYLKYVLLLYLGIFRESIIKYISNIYSIYTKC